MGRYCAICGGPFSGISISQQPRTVAFRERRVKEVENQRLRREGGYERYRKTADDDAERDSHEGNDEDHIYDQDVISEEDVQWTRTLHVLASNPDSDEDNKLAFLTVEADLTVTH